MASRDDMTEALRRVVVPVLKEQGYTGTFPHFRRIGPDQIDLLTFRFDKWGGGFVVEIGRCRPEGYTTSSGEHTPPDKVRTDDLHPDERFRLGAAAKGEDHWFRFDGRDRVDTIAWDVVTDLDQAHELLDQPPSDAEEEEPDK
jgi:uncharacterized protein YcgI (DUF1989 family)